MAINQEQLDEIEATYNALTSEKPCLMVGFNRRFSPHSIELKKQLLSQSSPKVFIVTINAGFVDKNHWTQNIDIGGGRIIGETCHFIDLLRFFVGCEIDGFNAIKIGGLKSIDNQDDNVSITLSFKDCLLYTSPSPRDGLLSRMPSSA